MSRDLPARARGSAGGVDRLRPVRVPPAGPGVDALRAAYLELLKLALCDLAGAGTTALKGLSHGRLVSREVDSHDFQERAHGRDWPLHALTMTGLVRLDDLQTCVEAIVRDNVPGDLIEAGSWRGGSSILMRATLDTLGAAERTVWVADSFQGFPKPEPPGTPSGYTGSLAPYFAAFDFLAVPLEEVRENFARFGYEHGVRFVPGFFEDTLPGLTGGEQRWSVVRLDGDTYDVTLLALRCLYPNLSPGGYLIIDDYLALDECRQAVDDFRREHGIEEPVEQVDWTCARWRRVSDAPIEPVLASAERPPAPRQAMPRKARQPIPTGRELDLERELDELGKRLDEAHARGQALEQQLREVAASTSWRLTRPLRQVRARAKRPH